MFWNKFNSVARALAGARFPLRGHLATPAPAADAELVRISGLFDQNWYLTQNADPLHDCADPVAHYMTVGFQQRRNPSPYFNTSWYLETYPDVAQGGGNPLVHFIKYGAKERRSPGPYFDTDWYLNKYRDVASAQMNALWHFVTYGEAEGRNPSADFSTEWYRKTYLLGDPASNFPLRHYLTVGHSLGNAPIEDPVDIYFKHVSAREQCFWMEQEEIIDHISSMPIKPTFLIYVSGNKKINETYVQLFNSQIYSHWVICSNKAELLTEAAKLTGLPFYVTWLTEGDYLHDSALYSFASAVNAYEIPRLIYADDDLLLSDGRRANPFYKPDWSPDYLESCNFIGSTACVEGNIACEIISSAVNQFDFLLRATESNGRVHHIRSLLGHRRGNMDDAKKPSQIAEDISCLNGRLARTGRKGVVKPLSKDVACYNIKLVRSDDPLISVVIPTAANIVDFEGKSIDLIKNCIDLILNRSTYKNLEIIIVDNGDISRDRLDEIHALGVKSVTYEEAVFNIAKKINLGATLASGEFLLLLNDDIEPLASDWIERILDHFEKPHVGVVGAKLLYPDLKTQHVGLVLNSSNPDHASARCARDDGGYFFSTSATRNFIAVTGAVMMTRLAEFRAVGGYSEALAVSYNDVDFCLKISERGSYIVYEAQAELIHYESLSRARILDFSELRYFHERWAHISSDPFYNEQNLTIAPPTYEVHYNGSRI